MLLANYSDYKTAGDIVNIRKIKAHLDRLMLINWLKKVISNEKSITGDRRKTQLLLTKRAQPIIERGRTLQDEFFNMMFANTSEKNKNQFLETIKIIDRNLNNILKGCD